MKLDRAACLGLLLGAVLGASQAAAAPLTPSPLISVSVTSGYDYYADERQGTDLGDGTFYVAGVGERPGDFLCDWNFTVDPDPAIAGTFKLTNLSASAQDFIMNITLPVVPALSAPTRMGGYVGDVLLVNSNGFGQVVQDDSATLETVGANPLYQAQIDSVAVRNLFGGLSLPACCGDGVSAVQGRISFGDPIPSAVGPAVATNMRIQVQFNLTAGDRAEVPVFFRVEPALPEPATGLMLGLAAAALLAIRRRT